ncbi:MAG TPA: phosphoribosyl-AMP cyclohydrolase [Methyloceanibacter sp.]|nr:phosphoribosyl-AMP cyclohydrolase [Methyloceanibacter sp.]
MSKPAVFPPPGDDKSEIEEGTVFTPRFDADGLIPVVAISASTGEVLMLAYMNAEALALTIETGEAHYWSRSRGELWRKGETSGNSQRVVELRTDCDQDALLLKVEMSGSEASCHTGRRSCFYRALPVGEAIGKGGVALRLIDAERQFDPETVYRHAGAAKGTLKKSE